MKKKLILGLFTLLSLNIFAQETNETPNKEINLFQMSVIYPLSNYGYLSIDSINKYSLNLFMGINGGLTNFELGSLGNVNIGKVRGLQIAGLTNVTTQTSQGVQFAGLTNVTIKEAKGAQFAGAANVTNDGMTGFSLAGISNINKGSFTGLQVSGLTNITSKNVKGVQIASLLNMSSQEMNGVQIGLINMAGKLSGIQLGFINYSYQEENGTPIGLINIVKNGYYAFEINMSPSMIGSFRYKMGTKNFYTILNFGGSYFAGNNVLSSGIGFGHLFPVDKKQEIGLEVSTSYIAYDKNWRTGINFLNKLDVNYHFNFNPHLAISAGPSLNLYISDKSNNSESLFIPYTIYSKDSDLGFDLWIGANIGFIVTL